LFARAIHRVFIVGVLLVAVGCSRTAPTIQESVVKESVSVSPLQSTSPVSPGPDAQVGKPDTPLPDTPPEEPAKGKGTVVGTLHDQAEAEPYAYQYIYLAPTRQMTSQNTGDKVAYFAELDVTSDPFAQTDEHGRLVIRDVEPGLYTLAVRLPNLQEILLFDGTTSQNVIVTVEADKVSDLGVVDVVVPK
jgi:hypothetical protein